MDFGAASKQLRLLARERDAGTLAPAEYRRARGRLLDALVGLTPRPVDLEVTQPRSVAAGTVAAESSTEISPSNAPRPTSARRTDGGRKILVLLSLAVIVIVVAAVSWLQLYPKHSASSLAMPASAPPAATVAHDNIELLIADFLGHADWSDGAISTFNAAWWRLSDDEVVAALGSTQGQELSRRLSDHLRRHATHDSTVVPSLDPNSPLLIMASNLNVTVPEGAVASSAAPVASAREQVEIAPRASPTANKDVPGRTRTASANQAPPAMQSTINKTAAAGGDKSVTSPVATPAPAAASGKDVPHSVALDPCAEANLPPRRRSCWDLLSDGRRGPTLRVIKAGSFMMGSRATAEEQPVHEVRIAQPFALMESEVSAGDYAYYCQQTHKTCPAAPWDGDTLPVVNVSRTDAHDYAAWLSALTKQQYRLPTEAEWEYAARGGESGEPGLDGVPVRNPASEARYSAPGMVRSSPVSVEDTTYKLNAVELRHMLGNVREWIEDGWSVDYAKAKADGSANAPGTVLGIVRGGSFRDGPNAVRPGARVALDAGTRDTMTGFRLLRVIRAP